jgi:hypothetical protein
METDVHAAASALLLAGIAGIGLLYGSRTRQAAVGILLTFVGLGLWLTGSRVAIMLGIAASLVAIAWRVFHGGRRAWLSIGATALVALALGGWLATRDPSSRYNTVAGSMAARMALTKAALQVGQQAPMFGIGITKLYSASAAFIGPSAAALSGYAKENAHNNFVQMFAEQGLVGLCGLLWLLGVVLIGAARSQRSSPDPIRGALLAATVLCIGTWLAGHPLLVPEFALLFWLYVGTLAGLTPSPQTTAPGRWLVWVPAVLVLGTIPVRASALRDAAGLEHYAFGVSRFWQHDDTQRYRETGRAFALFLPVTGRPVEVPIRRAPGAPDPLVVEVTVGGRLLDEVPIEGDAWRSVLVQIPQGRRLFELVDFSVRAKSPGQLEPGVWLRVGRDSIR